MRLFDPKELKKLKKPQDSHNGQVTIVGGSDLFHGAPILALRIASRIVDMVYFSTPEPSVGKVAENLKSQLGSFIWVPWDEVEAYIQKSDAILIGVGMKRWHKEENPPKEGEKVADFAGRQTHDITERFLKKFPRKQWVIDAGSLQVMDPEWIPQKAILTPNQKEFKLLFGDAKPKNVAHEYNCVVVLKGPTTTVCSSSDCLEVSGGNQGLTKGGTGDVQAGLTVALAAQNEPLLAAAASAWTVKAAADELYGRAGTVYSADDLAEEIPKILGDYLR